MLMTQAIRAALAAQVTANYGNPHNALVGLLLDLLPLPVAAPGVIEVIEGTGDITIPLAALWYEYAADGGTITVDSGGGSTVTRPEGFALQPIQLPGGLANEVALANGTGTVHWRYAIVA